MSMSKPHGDQCTEEASCETPQMEFTTTLLMEPEEEEFHKL
jgi:hypothetical protein